MGKKSFYEKVTEARIRASFNFEPELITERINRCPAPATFRSMLLNSQLLITKFDLQEWSGVQRLTDLNDIVYNFTTYKAMVRSSRGYYKTSQFIALLKDMTTLTDQAGEAQYTKLLSRKQQLYDADRRRTLETARAERVKCQKLDAALRRLCKEIKEEQEAFKLQQSVTTHLEFLDELKSIQQQARVGWQQEIDEICASFGKSSIELDIVLSRFSKS